MKRELGMFFNAYCKLLACQLEGTVYIHLRSSTTVENLLTLLTKNRNMTTFLFVSQVHNTAPTYQGPFSTTISKDVAHTFCKNKGLLISVKGSYSNPIRFIIGIDMIGISCFKHEKEVLLYSQTLPIRSTKTFEENNEKMVNHLIYSIKSTKEPITDRKSFFRKIGVDFKKEWAALIVKHPMLMEQTENGQTITVHGAKRFKRQTVLQRLVKELGCDWISQFVQISKMMKDRITFDGAMITVKGHSESGFLRNYIFKVSVDNQLHEREYRFDEMQDLSILVISPSLDLSADGEALISLCVGPSDGSFEPLSLWTVKCQHPLPRYALNQETPLRIDKMLQVHRTDAEPFDKGTLYIDNSSDIVIAENAGIHADGAGLRRIEGIPYILYLRQRKKRPKTQNPLELSFGTMSDEFALALTSKTKEYSGSLEGAGGGIIALRSKSDIVNDGMLSSNGTAEGRYKGGTICLCADGAVMNRGKIESKPNGRIIIRCRKFVNEGAISPVPEVLITDGPELQKVGMVMMPWSGLNGAKMKEIPLTVYRHRGHQEDDEKYHPRNLLDGKGTKTEYIGGKPAKDDWIIFRMESESTVIPKAVIIRPHCFKADVMLAGWTMSVDLSLPVSGDSDEFETFAIISSIELVQLNKESDSYYNLKDEMIKLEMDQDDVLISDMMVWMKNYKYLKLRVLHTWDQVSCNKLYTFYVLGLVCESKQ